MRKYKKTPNPVGPALKRAVAAMLLAGLQIKQVEFRPNGSFVITPGQRRERDDVVAGSPAIARALGVAPLTVQRMAKDGRLKVFKTGDASSPLKVRQSEIDRINGVQS